MATLKAHHKSFIVNELACFERPTHVIEAVKERFGIEVSNQQVNYYNPQTTRGTDRLAQKWTDLFVRTRQKFVEQTMDIPITNKAYRLKELQKKYDELTDQGEIMKSVAILEQGAKEVGGAYDSIADRITEQGGSVNFIQQINKKILQINKQKE